MTNIFSVSGKQRHRGLEWTVTGELAAGKRVLGGINYIDAELTRTEPGLQDGNQAPGVRAGPLPGLWSESRAPRSLVLSATMAF